MTEIKKKCGFLQDANGDNSSKRLAGFSMLGLGAILAIILFIFCIFRPIGDANTAKSIIETIFWVSGILLGAGVLENFKFKRGEQ